MGWVLTCFALIAVVDLIPILRHGLKSCVLPFAVLFGGALALQTLLALHAEVPSVLMALDAAMKAVGLSY